MLETTLSAECVPGTNLREGLKCADWRYLLPGQDYERALCIGVPSRSALRALSTIARRVSVVGRDREALQTMAEGLHDECSDGIDIRAVETWRGLPVGAACVGLVYLTGARGGVEHLREATVRSEIIRVLKPGGVVYVEIGGWRERVTSRDCLTAFLRQGFQVRGSFWLTPLAGDLRTAVPLNDDEATSYFFKNVIYGRSRGKRILGRIGALMSRASIISRLAPRRAMVLERSGGGAAVEGVPVSECPEYLQAIAAEAGINVGDYTYALSARGRYNSNKVVFFLFSRRSRALEVVIKMTRSPEFNHRLENEYQVLARLGMDGYVDQASFPEPLFLGHHKGLALVALKAIHGRPFRTQTRATPDCPLARGAIEWITQLGTASATRTAASSADVGDVLRRMFDSFRNIYDLRAEEEEFLAEQVDVLSRSGAVIPLVCQHGDPGTWNILVSGDGNRITMIDWEAGELEGMPLWDLLYFFRTYASWVSRQQGRGSGRSAFGDVPMSTELHSVLVDVVERYRAGVRLDRRLIKPLFYACWMHRALKEAARLTETSLQDGRYLGMLRMCIEQRNAPVLRALWQEK